MKRLLFLKLGGSLITDKRVEASARQDVIDRLAREVRRALDEQPDLSLVIGHGSGSFGHFAAQACGFAYGPQADWRGFVQVGAAAARLNRIVVDGFLAGGVPVFALQPSASAVCRAGQPAAVDDAVMRSLLDEGCVPVVYGDVCRDEEWGWTIISTEQILAHLSQVLRPERILLAGEVAGVYSANPAAQPEALPVPEITPASFEAIRAGLSGADGYDVTGGMLSKVGLMVDLVRQQPELEVHLISGLQADQVHDALLDRPVTPRTVIRA